MTLAEANTDVARMLPIWMNSWPSAPGANRRVLESWRIAPALRLAGTSPVDVLGTLAEAGIAASITPYREEHVRAGPSIVTSPDEVDRLLDALKT